MTKSFREEIALTIINMHNESCGIPPNIIHNGRDGKYVSYFETDDNEQSIFVYNYLTAKAIVYIANRHWEEELAIDIDKKRITPEMITDQPKALWIAACCLAVKEDFRYKKQHPDWKPKGKMDEPEHN